MAAAKEVEPIMVTTRNIRPGLNHHQHMALMNGLDKFDEEPGTFNVLIKLLDWRKMVEVLQPELLIAFGPKPNLNDEDGTVRWEIYKAELKKLFYQRLGGHALEIVKNNKDCNVNWDDLVHAFSRGISKTKILYTLDVNDFATAAKFASVLRALDEQLPHLTTEDKKEAVLTALTTKRNCPATLVNLSGNLHLNGSISDLASAICELDAKHEIFNNKNTDNSGDAGNALIMYTSSSNTIEICETCGGLLHDARACPSELRAVSNICTWCYSSTHTTDTCRTKTKGYTTGKPRFEGHKSRSSESNWRNNNKHAHIHATFTAPVTPTAQEAIDLDNDFTPPPAPVLQSSGFGPFSMY
jgi:hypothetical protein